MKSALYLSSINSYYNIAFIEKELINTNRNIELFDRLIKEDDIPFDEYIDIINKLYNVTITDNDLIKISSCILGSKCWITVLDTDILCEVTKSCQVNNFFEYADEIHKLYIRVASFDKLIDINYKYSYEEVLKLSNENKIVILEFVLDDESDCYEEITEFRMLSTLKDFTSSFMNLKYFEKEYIPVIYTLLKEYFSIYKLNQDFTFYMDDIRKKLDLLDKYVCNFEVPNLNNINLECNKIRQRKISKGK